VHAPGRVILHVRTLQKSRQDAADDTVFHTWNITQLLGLN
jgi:hypothetical protein